MDNEQISEAITESIADNGAESAVLEEKGSSLDNKFEKVAQETAKREKNWFDKKAPVGKPADIQQPKKDGDGQVAKKPDLPPKEKRVAEPVRDEKGNIIAEAGRERRQYEDALKKGRDWDQFQQQVLPKIQEQYNEAISVAKDLKAIKGAADAANLSTSEMNIGIQFASRFKNNPVDAIKYVLTYMSDNGINMEELLPSTQSSAMAAMLKRELDPFRSMLTEREESNRLLAEQAEQEKMAQESVQQFFNTFPYSFDHKDEIAEVVSKAGLAGTQEDYRAAYFQLREYYEKNGMNFANGKQAPRAAVLSKAEIPAPLVKRPVLSNGGNMSVRGPSVNMSTGDLIRQSIAELKQGGSI